MKIPALFKQPFTPDTALKKEFTSSEGESSSAFFEWKDSVPSEVVFHARKNSILECVFVQNLPLDSESMARIRIIADRGAEVRCTLVHQGSKKSQIEFQSVCADEGARISIQALANSRELQKHAFLANAQHPVPRTQSDLKVWCVARDSAQTLFHGVITIEQGAHHTEALQKNRNLILSEKATVDSIPELFIYNDEVKCAHGSSTSTLDPEQSLYLQSRGISHADAETMITRGFMENAIHWIQDEKILASVRSVLGLKEEVL